MHIYIVVSKSKHPYQTKAVVTRYKTFAKEASKFFGGEPLKVSLTRQTHRAVAAVMKKEYLRMFIVYPESENPAMGLLGRLTAKARIELLEKVNSSMVVEG